MSIIKVQKRDNPFVQIDKRVLNDERISWKAKGILAYLLSKPNDWVAYITDIEKKSKDGRDSVRAGINELIEIGYIQRIRTRDKNGKFKGWEYVVYEQPTNGKTEIGKSEFGKTEIGKSDTTNKEITNNDLTNNELDMYVCKRASEFYQQNFGFLSPYVFEQIEYWCKDLSEDLVIKAMKIALSRNKHDWAYVNGILRVWAKRNVKTLEDVRSLRIKKVNNKKKSLFDQGEESRRRQARAEKEAELIDDEELKRMVEEMPF